MITIMLMFATIFWLTVYFIGKRKKKKADKIGLEYVFKKESDIEKSKTDKEYALKTIDEIDNAIAYNRTVIQNAKTIEERNFFIKVENDLVEYKNGIIEVM